MNDRVHEIMSTTAKSDYEDYEESRNPNTNNMVFPNIVANKYWCLINKLLCVAE